MLALLVACSSTSLPGTPRWLPPVSTPQWSDEPVEDLVLARRFEALLPEAVVASVRCEAEDDPLEVHELDTEPARFVQVVLYGLLADTTYACTMVADGVEATTTFTTDPLPDWLPSWHLTTTGAPWGGYVLLNHGTDFPDDRRTKLLIVDVDGNLRWYRKIPYEAPDLDAQYLGDGWLLYGGGYAVPPTIADLSGATLLRAPALADEQEYNHHAERLADGDVLTIATADNDDGKPKDGWRGFELRMLDPTLSFVTWRWNSQRGHDEGWLPAAPPDNDDPYHANATGVMPDGDVWVNARSLSELHLLDRATGDRIWTLGPGQDFRLVGADGGEADPADWFYMPHAPEFHGDHVWVHDNGVGRPGGSFSRVAELQYDTGSMTARLLWSWTEPGWYEPIWGDVDVLPNGHVSVTRGHCDHCTHLHDERTEVLELDPTTDEVVWRLTFDDPHDAGYRSERIDGCAIFANRRYCP